MKWHWFGSRVICDYEWMHLKWKWQNCPACHGSHLRFRKSTDGLLLIGLNLFIVINLAQQTELQQSLLYISNAVEDVREEEQFMENFAAVLAAWWPEYKNSVQVQVSRHLNKGIPTVFFWLFKVLYWNAEWPWSNSSLCLYFVAFLTVIKKMLDIRLDFAVQCKKSYHEPSSSPCSCTSWTERNWRIKGESVDWRIGFPQTCCLYKWPMCVLK